MVRLFIVASKLAEENLQDKIRSSISTMIANVESILSIDFLNDKLQARDVLDSYVEKTSGVIILVATGGSEKLIQKITESLNVPVLLWANPHKNSLAASIEAFAALKEKHPIKLFYSELQADSVHREIEMFCRICNGLYQLNNSNIACVGQPSGWLLTSQNVKSFGKFTTSLIQLEINELTNLVDCIESSQAQSIADMLYKKFDARHIPHADLIASAKVYLAMKTLAANYNLEAITIKCFDLLKYKYTACMGMALCNDEGIVSSCEGDLQATFTMLLGQFLTGMPCWMANPSAIFPDENTIILAHCTIPTQMLADFSQSCLRTHMESDLSVAIQGPLKQGDVTLIRVGGNFDKMTVATGILCQTNMGDETLCRTQAKIKLDGSVNKWLDSALGNHQILLYGNQKEILLDFCKFANIEFIEI